jgi:hypothetical protein
MPYLKNLRTDTGINLKFINVEGQALWLNLMGECFMALPPKTQHPELHRLED